MHWNALIEKEGEKKKCGLNSQSFISCTKYTWRKKTPLISAQYNKPLTCALKCHCIWICVVSCTTQLQQINSSQNHFFNDTRQLKKCTTVWEILEYDRFKGMILLWYVLYI